MLDANQLAELAQLPFGPGEIPAGLREDQEYGGFRIHWTGWKKGGGRIVSQLIGYIPDRQTGPYLFVNLPNMAGGRYEKFDTFDITSTEKQDAMTKTQQGRVKLLSAGLGKMMVFIDGLNQGREVPYAGLKSRWIPQETVDPPEDSGVG